MSFASTEEISKALDALEERRKRAAAQEVVDNAALRAGEPIFLPCKGCGVYVTHPELYVDRIELCAECETLKGMGLL